MKIKKIEYDFEFGVMVTVEGLEQYKMCFPLTDKITFETALKQKVEQIQNLTQPSEPSLSPSDQTKLDDIKTLEGTDLKLNAVIGP